MQERLASNPGQGPPLFPIALLTAPRLEPMHAPSRRVPKIRHPEFLVHIAAFCLLPTLPRAEEVDLSAVTTIEVAAAGLPSVPSASCQSRGGGGRPASRLGPWGQGRFFDFHGRFQRALEDGVKALDRQVRVIAQPALLHGGRDGLPPPRLGLWVAMRAVRRLAPLPTCGYRPVPVRAVALALLRP